MTSAERDRRVVVVTGATRGCGRGIALAFAQRGDAVVVVGRSTNESPNHALPGTLEEIDAAARAAGAERVLSIRADVSRPDDVQHVVDLTIAELGRCDVLVNNAAVSFLGGFLDVPATRWSVVAGVNLLGPVMLTHGFLGGMIERGSGSIVNIGSVAAHSDGGATGQLAYAVTKLALEKFTTGLALQLAGTGVAVSTVRIDGVVATEGVQHHMPHLLATAMPVDEFAPVVVWMAERGVDVNGAVYGFDELRSLGAFDVATSA